MYNKKGNTINQNKKKNINNQITNQTDKIKSPNINHKKSNQTAKQRNNNPIYQIRLNSRILKQLKKTNTKIQNLTKKDRKDIAINT